MTKNEKAQITEAILKQKIANNKKAEALYAEHRERKSKAEGPGTMTETIEEQDDTILLRIARIAYGLAVR